MSPPRLIAGLAEIAGDYDALLCDVWGVVHNGRERFAEACAALARFRGERGPVILISNAPRPGDDVLPQLAALGVPAETFDALVTSGDAPLYEGLGLAFTGPENAAFIACTGPEDDTRETPDDYRARLAPCAARGLVMICANPDRVVQRGAQLIYCGGALAELYETLGGPVVMAGKPHAPIYELALAEAEARRGRPLDRTRVLSIGDGVATDLAGAAAERLDALFIAHGIHASELLGANGALEPTRLEAFLAREGGRARYAMAALGW